MPSTGKVLLPIVSPQKNLPGVYSLQLQGAGRFEYYSDFGTTVKPLAVSSGSRSRNWRFALPIHRAFRAPSLSELFIGAIGWIPTRHPGYGAVHCPKSRRVPGPPTMSVPARTFSTKVVTGGNPDLQPENSDSYYVEGAYQPPFVKGLTVTIGGGYIKIKDVISAPNPAFVVANPGLFPAGSVVRDTANPAFVGDPGAIIQINSQNVNINEQDTWFVDFEANYIHDTETLGNFTFHGAVTYVPMFNQSSPDAGTVVLAGNGSFPRYRGVASTFWQGPKDTWAEKFSFGPTSTTSARTKNCCFPRERSSGGGTLMYRPPTKLRGKLHSRLAARTSPTANAPRSLGQNGEGYDSAVYGNQGRFIYGRITKRF